MRQNQKKSLISSMKFFFESASQANKYGNMMGPVIGNIGNLQFVLTAVLGGILSVAGIGGITLGVMASYLQFTKSFTQPFMQVAQQFNSIVMALAGAERIFNLIDEKPEEDEGYVTLVNARKDENGNIVECKERTGMWAWKHPHSADGSVSYTELKGDVRFENVTFGYNEDKTILHDISLYAKPGQKLAFVGSTGAGKTTITNLINRFYDIQEGKIRYDGINITKIKKDDLRHSLGIVLQDTHLFTGTIRDNIRYGKLDATDEEIYAAAKLAHADQFIQMLPKGYDTMLSGDGEELSQGQRQLLSIARAAVADPPVLILDEATSSIDTRTESIVQKGMDNLMKGRTVFVIAHRLLRSETVMRLLFWNMARSLREVTTKTSLNRKELIISCILVNWNFHKKILQRQNFLIIWSSVSLIYSVICEKKNGAICATINCIFIPDVVYCQQKEMGAQYVKIMDTGRRTGQR